MEKPTINNDLNKNNDPRSPSRRRFLYQSGIVAGSLALVALRGRAGLELINETKGSVVSADDGVDPYTQQANLKANRRQTVIREEKSEIPEPQRALRSLTRNELGFYEKPVYSGELIGVTSIVLHWTAALYEPENTVGGLINGLSQNPACGSEGCSVQLFVDKEATVYQLTPRLDMFTIHARGFNDCSIGIEIEGRGEEDLLNNTIQYQAVLETVAKVRSQFDIPLIGDVRNKRGVFGHYLTDEFNGPGVKSDPGPHYMQRLYVDLTV